MGIEGMEMKRKIEESKAVRATEAGPRLAFASRCLAPVAHTAPHSLVGFFSFLQELVEWRVRACAEAGSFSVHVPHHDIHSLPPALLDFRLLQDLDLSFNFLVNGVCKRGRVWELVLACVCSMRHRD